MQIAEKGNIVEWESKRLNCMLRGIVIGVMDNVVTVDQTINPNWQELKLDERTVVNHKRYTIIDSSVDTLVVEKHASVTSLKVVPGNLDNYIMFKKEGYSDNKIRMMWQDADKEVKWHANKFHTWKAEHGLVKSHAKDDELSTSNDKLDVTKLKLEKEEIEAVVQKAADDIKADASEMALKDAPVKPIANIDELIEQVKNTPLQVVPSQNVALLHAELNALKAELDTTRRELWAERTSRLFSMQAELDALICESNRLQISDYDNEHILATIVELAEVAQEEQSFKYWKKNKSVDRAKLLEELADVLHFILSRGVQHGVRQVVLSDIEPRETVADQMLLIIELLVEFRTHLNKTNLISSLFQAFYGLTVLLKYDWSEIVSAYEVKNLENKARQNNNY